MNKKCSYLCKKEKKIILEDLELDWTLNMRICGIPKLTSRTLPKFSEDDLKTFEDVRRYPKMARTFPTISEVARRFPISVVIGSIGATSTNHQVGVIQFITSTVSR